MSGSELMNVLCSDILREWDTQQGMYYDILDNANCIAVTHDESVNMLAMTFTNPNLDIIFPYMIILRLTHDDKIDINIIDHNPIKSVEINNIYCKLTEIISLYGLTIMDE